MRSLVELDRDSPPADKKFYLCDVDPADKHTWAPLLSETDVIPAGSFLRTVHRCQTARVFGGISILHGLPVPDDVDCTSSDTLGSHIMQLITCQLHWRLRVIECLVVRVVMQYSGSAAVINRINALWKSKGIHAKIVKKQGEEYDVFGVDGEAVDKITLFFREWLPADVVRQHL
jgi:hypothetical protein